MFKKKKIVSDKSDLIQNYGMNRNWSMNEKLQKDVGV